MPETRVPELSVFFPAHNEEANVRPVTEAILAVLPEVAERYELLIVDDGSTDATPELADGLAEEFAEVRVIHHPTNRGYGGAIRTGLYNCRLALIAFIDGDGQFDFGEVRPFLAASERADLIIGYRVRRQDSALRSFNARAWGTLIRIVFGLRVRDIDCAFKLLHRRVLAEIPRLRSDGAMVSAELLIRAQRAGLAIQEVPVQHYPRTAGEQSGANLRVILRAFRDLLALRRSLQD